MALHRLQQLRLGRLFQIAEHRATWTINHVRAQAHRQLRYADHPGGPEFVSRIVAAALGIAANLGDRQRADTAYADYAVEPVERPGMESPRAFVVNNQFASVIDDSRPPQYARYVQHIRRVLLDDLGLADRDILVLGAGGFTLSHREPLNRYTYVDIDPAIRAIAEREFLREGIAGEFVATDARRFVVDTPRRFAAVVVDVYSARTSIPGHLVTREFWRDTRIGLRSSPDRFSSFTTRCGAAAAPVDALAAAVALTAEVGREGGASAEAPEGTRALENCGPSHTTHTVRPSAR